MSPSRKRTFEPQPAIRSSASAASPWNSGTSRRAVSIVCMVSSLARSDRGQLLGDVDPDRAPRDAAAAADAARAAELVVPRAELVREPLSVPRPVRGPDATPVDVRVLDREARVPRAHALRVVAREVGDVLDARAETGRADQRAIPAGEAP